jgi:hypothetical protein
VGEPLKRIYKASQEKKERSSPKGAKWFFFLPRRTRSYVSETLVRECDRTFIKLLCCLLYCFCFRPFYFRVPAFALHGSLSSAGAATIYASNSLRS